LLNYLFIFNLSCRCILSHSLLYMLIYTCSLSLSPSFTHTRTLSPLVSSSELSYYLFSSLSFHLSHLHTLTIYTHIYTLSLSHTRTHTHTHPHAHRHINIRFLPAPIRLSLPVFSDDCSTKLHTHTRTSTRSLSLFLSHAHSLFPLLSLPLIRFSHIFLSSICLMLCLQHTLTFSCSHALSLSLSHCELFTRNFH